MMVWVCGLMVVFIVCVEYIRVLLLMLMNIGVVLSRVMMLVVEI